MARRQGIVVEEHGALKLKVLLQEWHGLDLALIFLETRRVFRQTRDLLNIPDVGRLGDVLVAVDFGLLVAPVWKRRSVSPHGDLGREVDELEVRGHGLELLLVLAVLNSDLEEGIVETLVVRVFEGNGSELLVRGVERRSDIVSKKPTVSHQVTETDNIAVLDGVATAFHLLGRDDLPEVVGVVVRVASDLLALGRDATVLVTQRVFVNMRVKVDLGVLVLHRNVVEVVNSNGLLGHEVVAQCLLEFRRHEIITGTRSGKDGEVDLEPEEVHHERHNDESNDASAEVLAKSRDAQRALLAVDVEQVPEVDDDRHTDREEGEGTDVLGANNAGHADTSQKKPLPPLPTKRRMTELVETDVAQNAQGHEENQSGIEQDEASLTNVRVVKENDGGRNNARREAVARLPHDPEDHADGQGTHHSRHRSVRDVRNSVGDVRVANVLEEEGSIIADQPTSECEEELAKGRVNIKEVGSLKVVRCKLRFRLSDCTCSIIICSLVLVSYLAKVHFIEHHLVGMANPPEARDECQDRYDSESKLVVPFSLYSLLRRALELVDRVVCDVWRLCCVCVGCAALPSSLADSVGGHCRWSVARIGSIS